MCSWRFAVWRGGTKGNQLDDGTGGECGMGQGDRCPCNMLINYPPWEGSFRKCLRKKISALAWHTHIGPQHSDSTHIKFSSYILDKFDFLEISLNKLIFLINKANIYFIILLIFFVSYYYYYY